MERFRLIVIFVTNFYICVSSVYTARGFYCRDPDTGKLYAANTTWPATSFCGTYTCKLTKKDNQNEPIRRIEVLSNMSVNLDLNKNMQDDRYIEQLTKNKTELGKNEESNIDKFKNVNVYTGKKDGDRYLTEEEIKAMTILLQTVKKSDLEAVLDVYNLAQVIYKEIDKIADVNLIQGLIKDEEQKAENKPYTLKDKPFTSYWYEPFIYNSNKHKEAVGVSAANTVQTSQKKFQTELKDMPQNVVFVEKPKNLMDNLKGNPQVLLRESFSKDDVAKNPYYYPMSKFQRESSYVYQANGYLQNPDVDKNSAFQQPDTSLQSGMMQEPDIQTVALEEGNDNIQDNPYQQIETFLKASSYPQMTANVNLQVGNSYPDQDSQNRQPNNLILKPSDNSFRKGESFSQTGVVFTPKMCPKLYNQDGTLSNVRYDGKPCWQAETINSKMPLPYNFDTKRLYDMRNKPVYDETKPAPNTQNLNYPLAYLQYNISAIPQTYFPDSNSWSLLNLYNKHRGDPYLRAAYVAHLPHPVFVNANERPTSFRDENSGETVINSKSVQNEKNTVVSDWKTEPLSISVINEVKANVEDPRLLPFPLRKKIKLEKVGKTYKMDKMDKVNRLKRTLREVWEPKKAVLNAEEYEVYIEKLTCETDTEPGFFRVGVLTEPYPACCPQRIS